LPPNRPDQSNVSCAHARVAERAIGVVEIIIAVMLLSIVISGLALAVSGGSKLQQRTTTAERLSLVGQKVFEHLRGDTSWMAPCSTLDQWCDVSSAVDREVLEDDEFGPGCGGSDTYRHDLVEARVMPIDSEVDGKGTADRDGTIPDHFRVRVVIGVPSCARDRLGDLQPAVYESAIDPRGRIPKGSLTVEVCAATNQIDDRSSIVGCSVAEGGGFRKQPCPGASPVFLGTPAEGCATAFAWTSPLGISSTRPTPYVSMRRSTANFVVMDAGGGVVARSGDGDVRRPEVGLYEFPELPAGTYRLASISPTGIATGMPLWDTKVIPSLDSTGTGASVIVQPDVRSAAMLAFRPRDAGALTLSFSRRVRSHNVVSVRTAEQLAERFIQTSSWEGDPELLQSVVGEQLYTLLEIRRACAQTATVECDIEWVYLPGVGVSGSGDAPGMNCIRFGWIIKQWKRTDSGARGEQILDQNEVYNTCTRYDLYVRFTYDTTQRLPDQIRQGAAMGATYATMPAPTYRAMVPSASVTSGGCTVSSTLPGFGGRLPRIEQGCVATRDATRNRIRLGPFAPGLHAGIRPFAATVTTGWDDAHIDDGGGGWVVGRNESDRGGAIPAGLKQGFFVGVDGTIETPDGRAYAPGTTLDVVGTGECYWRYEMGAERMGSCDPCEPYVQPLGGTYPSCYILRRVEWRRHVYYTGGWAAQDVIAGSWDESGDRRTTQVCSAPPLPGDHIKTAPNCRIVFRATSGGGRSEPGEIPEASVPTSYGNVGVPATGIGG
jgi:hypothetical protein